MYHFQFSFRAARISCGYTLEKASSLSGIDIFTLNNFEIDSENATIEMVKKILSSYHTPLDYIFLGREIDCFEHNRSIPDLCPIIK